MSNDFIITAEERRYLRELAKKQAEYAALPIMAERTALWYRHNALRGERPVVVMEMGTFERDMLPDPQVHISCGHRDRAQPAAPHHQPRGDRRRQGRPRPLLGQLAHPHRRIRHRDPDRSRRGRPGAGDRLSLAAPDQNAEAGLRQAQAGHLQRGSGGHVRLESVRRRGAGRHPAGRDQEQQPGLARRALRQSRAADEPGADDVRHDGRAGRVAGAR